MITLKDKQKIRTLSTMGLSCPRIAERLNLAHNTVISVKKTRRTVMVVSDAHCGHEAGIVPPAWQHLIKSDKLLIQAKEVWEWYSTICDLIQPDTVFVLGDMMDGKGMKSGGSELITNQWAEQSNMAVEVIKRTGAKICDMCYGTAYHVGSEDDYEDIVANTLNSSGIKTCISGHGFPIIHQIQFSLKHKVGSSSIPHGRATQIKKEKLWAKLWAERGQMPKIDVLLRGHVHYIQSCMDYNGLAMICPSLSGWGSKFGVRQCSGVVDTGLMWFYIHDGDTVDTLEWHRSLPRLESQKIVPYSL